MNYNTTQKKHYLGLLPTLFICGTFYLLYRLFKSPELDREIERFAKKEAAR